MLQGAGCDDGSKEGWIGFDLFSKCRSPHVDVCGIARVWRDEQIMARCGPAQMRHDDLADSRFQRFRRQTPSGWVSPA